jgi:hypothetical protein
VFKAGNAMLRRRVVVAIVVLLVLVSLVAAGYLSTTMSVSRCYHAVAQVASRDLTHGRFFYLQAFTDEVAARAAFDSVGGRYSVLPPADDPRFPRLCIWTDRSIPFVLSISYLYETDFLVGEGATRSYICIFSWIIDRGQTSEIVS